MYTSISRRLAAVVTVLLLAVGCSSADPIAVDRTGSTSGSTPAPTVEPTSDDASVGAGEPGSVIIPAIDVAAELVGVGLAEDGSMETPDYDANQAGWYTEGPYPGEPGPAVIAAHVDSPSGNPDTFARLGELRPGDEITVIDETGAEHTWAVSHTQQTDKDELPYQEIWGDTPESVLRLITCAGAYVDEWTDNLIVYADPLT